MERLHLREQENRMYGYPREWRGYVVYGNDDYARHYSRGYNHGRLCEDWEVGVGRSMNEPLMKTIGSER